MALTEWPDAAPLRDVLAFARETEDPAHHVLALRAFLRLLTLPSQRTPAESVQYLEETMQFARTVEMKKARLGVLPRFASPEALKLAKAAQAEGELAAEAAQAIKRIQEALSYR